MGLEHLQPVRLCRPATRFNTNKAMAEIAIAGGTVVFRHAQVHDHEPVALARVFERALVRRLDAHRTLSAIQARRTLLRTRPNVNISQALHTVDDNASQS